MKKPTSTWYINQTLYFPSKSKKSEFDKETGKDYLTPPPWCCHQLCLWLPALGWTEWRTRCPTHLTQWKHIVSRLTDGLIVLSNIRDESIFLTHQKMKRIFFIFLDDSSHEELASKQVRGHKGAILCHPNFIWTELHPVCSLNHHVNGTKNPIFGIIVIHRISKKMSVTNMYTRYNTIIILHTIKSLHWNCTVSFSKKHFCGFTAKQCFSPLKRCKWSLFKHVWDASLYLMK